MTDLELVQARVDEDPLFVVPHVGSVVNLHDSEEVARALKDVREAKRVLDEVRTLLEGVLVLEAQRQGTKSFRLPGMYINITGGETVEWDAHRLELMLREAGLPEERIRDVVVETVSYKVNAREAKRVAGANPLYAEVVEACQRTVEAPLHAYVKPGS